MKILLIEDDRSCGTDIKEMIEEEGHDCTWIRGVMDVTGSVHVPAVDFLEAAEHCFATLGLRAQLC